MKDSSLCTNVHILRMQQDSLPYMPNNSSFNMQNNKGTYRELRALCNSTMDLKKKQKQKKTYGYNIYLPFTTQERLQNTY